MESPQSPRRKVKPKALAIVCGIALLVIWLLWSLLSPLVGDDVMGSPSDSEAVDPGIMYGISLANHQPKRFVVKSGQAFGSVLDRLGVDYPSISTLLEKGKEHFDPRRWRAGDTYWVFSTKDSLGRADYFVYESSKTSYVVFGLRDSLFVRLVERPVTIKEREVTGVITSSLYQTLESQDVSPAVAIRMSEIYAWTIDFFRLQKGDRFEIIFEEHFVDDTVFVRAGNILAVRFVHAGKALYAYYYDNVSVNVRDYYDLEGESLRRAFLRAPLEFGRITSRYTMKRFHPVQRRWKAHLGTDYAAPKGTPILSTAKGRIIAARYTSANGNYVKVKHNGTYTTQYLHMSRIKGGIKPGVWVEQGEVIGYVGATGLATGPHVCYRFWKNGVQVDALKQDLPKTESLPQSEMSNFLSSIVAIRAQLEALSVEG